jgi:hypothetical protein
VHPDVERLAEFVGPPSRQPESPPWAQSRHEIGFDFPSDYREFIDLYGSVRINGELSVWTPKLRPSEPGAPIGFPGFVWNTAHDGGVGDYLAGAYEDGDLTECPYPVYPAPGGLLIWGNNPNGDHCFWLTEGDDPDRWPIAIWYRQLAKWDRFDGGVPAFLLAIVTGRYELADEIAPRFEGVELFRQQSDWAS